MKRLFVRLSLILTTGCLPAVGSAAANPALPPCSKFPSGRNHVYSWTATLANGVLSAPLPNDGHTYHYFDFVAAEHDVQTDASGKKFTVIVPWGPGHGAYDYRLDLFGRAEHANGRYYFTGVYEFGRDNERASATRRDMLEIVLSGRFCLDSSG